MRQGWRLCLLGLLTACAAPRPRLHAHNDYLHPRPLQQALELGFTSVEADVFLVDGELRVGHERWQLRPGRTLELLYLDPLRERVHANGGQVVPGVATIHLLIDIKAEGAAVYRHLRGVLSRYRDMLTCFHDGGATPGAVTVILSGSRPRERVAAEAERLCAVDGRLGDLDLVPSPSPFLVPWISESWSKVCAWDGKDEPLPEEREQLRELALRVHAQGRQLRLWGAPDRVECWQVLADVGVDWIGSDRLRECAAWARSR